MDGDLDTIPFLRFVLFFQSTELRSKANKAPFPSNESETITTLTLRVVIALSALQ
jgi:hypothetical protein